MPNLDKTQPYLSAYRDTGKGMHMFLSMFFSSQIYDDFQFMFVCLDCNSHQTLEASSAAAEERIANGLTCTTILTGVGNTRCYLHLTAPSGVLGTTAAWESWQTDRNRKTMWHASLQIKRNQWTVLHFWYPIHALLWNQKCIPTGLQKNGSNMKKRWVKSDFIFMTLIFMTELAETTIFQNLFI